MKKKTATRIRTHHAPHFYIIFALVMVFAGAFAALVATRVLGQTDNQIVYACAQKQTGALRLTTSGTACQSNETSITWNIQGPQGIQGLPGPSGANGLPFFCSNCYLVPFANRFQGKDFSSAQIYSSYFMGADLTGVSFKGGHISNSDFSNTNLMGTDFSNLQNFPVDNVTSVIFDNANLTNANFSNSPFENGTSFKNANIQNTNFSNTSFKYVNFSGAQNGKTSNFSGTTWINTTCPDGTNSNNNGNTCLGHL